MENYNELDGLFSEEKRTRKRGEVKLNVSFHLKAYASKNAKEKPIMAYIHLNRWHDKYKPLTFSTGLKVHPELWDRANYKCIGQNEFLNFQLQTLKQIITRNFPTYLNDFTFLPSGEAEKRFKDRILKQWLQVKPTLTNNNKHMMSIPVTFNQHQYTDKIDTTQMTFSEYIKRTIPLKEKGYERGYILSQKEIENFPPCLLSELSHLYFKDLFEYWKTTKDWTVGTFQSYKKNAKVFYHYAQDTDKLELPKITFKEYEILKTTVSEDSKDVALSQRQLKRIYELENLPKHLEHTRDAMVIGVFAGGVRKHTLKTLQSMEEHIDVSGKRYFSIKAFSKKTKSWVSVTLHPIASELLIKHGDKIPNIVHDYKFDTYMQDVCKLAELTHKIRTQKEDLKTGEITEDYVPFSQLVSSGIIRKTFCTMMTKKPFSLDVWTVMAFSNHKSLRSFESYIADSGDVDESNAYTQMILNDTSFDKDADKAKLSVAK